MERRDGFETDLRRVRAGREMGVRWRRDAGGGETADANEAGAGWEMEARRRRDECRKRDGRRRRDGGELEARWRRDGGGTEAR